MFKLNRYVWRTLFIVFILLMLLTLIENGGRVSGVLVSCPLTTSLSCPNPFYNSFAPICAKDPLLCEIEYIPGGTTLGTIPGTFTKLFPLVSLFLLICGILAEVYLRVVKK